MEKTLYLVQYNNYYGNDEKKLEIIVESYEDFKKWLIKHNEERSAHFDDSVYFYADHYESEKEFDLIPLNLFIP